MHAGVGNIESLDKTMAAYRKHSNGAWIDVGKNDHWYVKFGIRMANFYNEQGKLFHVDKTVELNHIIISTIFSCIIKSDYDTLQLLKIHMSINFFK